MFKNGMRPVHPGEVLREEFLAPLHITPHKLSQVLHVTPAKINEIVREERGVTADTAMRLARAFGTTAEFWLNLQTAYELRLAAERAPQIEQEIQPLEFA
ncbi:MAG: HigA family addiction module antitoxin [Telluria sp.]